MTRLAPPSGAGESRFFRGLWRFNALAIALASVLLIGLGAFILVNFMVSDWGGRRVRNVVAVPPSGEAPATERTYRLGRAQVVPGHDVMRVSLLVAEKRRRGSSYGKASDSTVNVGFVDPRTLETRWLYPHRDHLVLSVEPVGVRGDTVRRGFAKVDAFLVHAVEADTNGDGTLSARDDSRLSVVRPDGTQETTIATGVSSLNGKVRDEGGASLVVFYEKGGATFAARVALDTFAVDAGVPVELPPL